ncbi:sensor histidine kinase [Sphingomonas nostoxanthinifaciens]|uniref:sensor histidine kinase n=1 Tax=Sphingomonas nostoxanthinifaciens TaxID=2872652 RepID=UPI001CC1EFA9|nr:PAS domain-containing sensor histidine kinase [Sphingomonas nostoxanthinifaciens]UAK25375.1 PAS-domain containing protein [Sphingomonas nostoxanthinifaciens]
MNDLAHFAPVVALGAVWLIVALIATVVGIRRTTRAGRAIDESHAIADLLAGSPAAPMLVYPDGGVDADPRVAVWIGLTEVPRTLEGLGGPGGFATEDLDVLAGEVAACRTTGAPIRRHMALPGSSRIFRIQGEPYSVRRDARRAVLLWFLDATVEQREVALMTERASRLARALDGLSALIEAAPFPMWHRGADMSLALVNGAYVRAIEAADAADVIARGLELIESGNGPTPMASAAAARERGTIGMRTAPAIVAGQRRMMRVVDVPIGEAGVAGYAIDIQELEEARADLGLFVRAQRDMLDRLSAGVAQFASDHSLVFCNRHFARLFAMEPDWLADRPEFDRVLERMRESQRAPESRDFPGWRAERRQWFSTTDPVEESWLLPGGTHLRVVAQPLPDRGLLLIFEDRTEHLQLASARDTLLRVRTATFDNLFEAVGVFAADGRLHLWNNRFREIWGLSEEELARHPRVDALVQAIAPKLLDPSRAGLIRELVRIATIDRQQRSGRISLIDGRHFEFAAVPLPDGNALFTLLDITASRGIEEALRDRNEALEEANQLKNAFVASMSYELRVPLTTITGFAELLAGGYAGELGDTARDYVESILSAVGRLSGLMNNALDLTQSVAGSLPMATEVVSMAELVRGTVDLTRDAARNDGLMLATDIAPESGEVAGDPKRLGQAIGHLLRNALSYTPAGGRILVRSRIVEEMAEVVISDNGRGMPAKQRERIFDRFSRNSFTPTDDEPEASESNGFGLPLARQLIEAHGGRIDLLSEVGRGTTAVIRLPLRQQDDTGASPA